jgi:peroxin-7
MAADLCVHHAVVSGPQRQPCYDCCPSVSPHDALAPTAAAADETHTPTHASDDACVYSTSFSPHVPFLVGSCSGSGHFALHDTRLPAGSPAQVRFVPFAPGIEALSFDFNKYDQGVVALAGTDKTVRVCDLRQGGRESARAVGHTFPARAVKWSPWKRSVFASAGYDMSCRMYVADPG